MKRTPSELTDDLRPEYEFDFKRMRPNRFAKRLKGKSVVAVVLDSDVADVFQSSAAVNDLLRSVIKAMPTHRRRTAARKRRVS